MSILHGSVGLNLGASHAPLLTVIGPAKSAPTLLKGGAGVILVGGSCPMSWSVVLV